MTTQSTFLLKTARLTVLPHDAARSGTRQSSVKTFGKQSSSLTLRVSIPIVLASILASGCRQPAVESGHTKARKDQADAPPAIKIVKLERKTVERLIEQPGFNIEAFQETPIFARISGYVRKWHVDLGDRVRAGDVLAELNVPEMVVELEQKDAAVRQSLARIEQAKAALLTAQAQLDRAKSQHDRLAKAAQNGVIDRESVEESKLGVESAKASIEQGKADIAFAEANLAVAAANRDYAKTMLQFAKITAPYDGVITHRNIKDGDLVQAAGAGKPLFVVAQLDPVRVFVNVPGAEAAWVKDGDPVTLRLFGAGGEVIKGKVTRNANSLNSQSRTLRIEVDLPNPEGRLLPGMYVHAAIQVRHADVWTLPASALATDGDNTYCYRCENGKAVRTPLQLGLRGDGFVEVLKEQVHSSSGVPTWQGVNGSEAVVANAAQANDGQPVR